MSRLIRICTVCHILFLIYNWHIFDSNGCVQMQRWKSLFQKLGDGRVKAGLISQELQEQYKWNLEYTCGKRKKCECSPPVVLTLPEELHTSWRNIDSAHNLSWLKAFGYRILPLVRTYYGLGLLIRSFVNTQQSYGPWLTSDFVSVRYLEKAN